MIVPSKDNRREVAANVPLDVAGEHAEEDVATDAIRKAGRQIGRTFRSTVLMVWKALSTVESDV